MLSSVTDIARRASAALPVPSALAAPLDRVGATLTATAVRAALIGGSLASGNLFWVRASLGENQLRMHDLTRDGEISIGGVSEQLYSEGFLGIWHEVLARELGERLPAVLYEVGKRGATWEVTRAIERKVWVPAILRSLVGRPELADKVRDSLVYHAVMKETLGILFRMVMTEGGWGRIDTIDLRATPMRIDVTNTPEPRRLGVTGHPVCHLMTGIYTGYFETIFGLAAQGREARCCSAGDPVCSFEITLAR